MAENAEHIDKMLFAEDLMAFAMTSIGDTYVTHRAEEHRPHTCLDCQAILNVAVSHLEYHMHDIIENDYSWLLKKNLHNAKSFDIYANQEGAQAFRCGFNAEAFLRFCARLIGIALNLYRDGYLMEAPDIAVTAIWKALAENFVAHGWILLGKDAERIVDVYDISPDVNEHSYVNFVGNLPNENGNENIIEGNEADNGDMYDAAPMEEEDDSNAANLVENLVDMVVNAGHIGNDNGTNHGNIAGNAHIVHDNNIVNANVGVDDGIVHTNGADDAIVLENDNMLNNFNGIQHNVQNINGYVGENLLQDNIEENNGSGSINNSNGSDNDSSHQSSNEQNVQDNGSDNDSSHQSSNEQNVQDNSDYSNEEGSQLNGNMS